MAKGNKSSKDTIEEIEDRLDIVLFECLEILKMNSKKRLTRKGIIDIYPVPVISKDCLTVLGVQYLPNRNLYLPDEIFCRLVYWDDFLESTAKNAKKRARPTAKDAKKWASMKDAGMKLKEIEELTGKKSSTISYYIKKYAKAV